MDKLEGKLVEVIAAIEKAAPAVWDTLVFQARLEGAIALAVSAFFAGLTWYGIRACRTPNRYNETFDRPLVVLPICAAFGVLVALPLAVTHIGNPEYQAIRDLVSVLK